MQSYLHGYYKSINWEKIYQRGGGDKITHDFDPIDAYEAASLYTNGNDLPFFDEFGYLSPLNDGL